MSKPKSLSAGAKGFLVALTLLLPTLTLVPLGGLYLWEHGFLLWWALGAFAFVSLTSLVLGQMVKAPNRDVAPPGEAGGQRAGPVAGGMEPHWNDLEAKAWADVQAIAAGVDLEALADTAYLSSLGHRTLNTVAKRLHPEKAVALWRFTVPEALAIIERVSRRLGTFVQASIPFGDRLTVAQVLSVYRWRHMADVAERAYDVWRLVRLASPATALTHEARERLSRAVYNFGKEQVSRRIAEAYVEEVGRAAIDLYSGRLQVVHGYDAGESGGSRPPALTPHETSVTRPVVLNVAIAGGARIDRVGVASILRAQLERHSMAKSDATAASLAGAQDVSFGEVWPASRDAGESAEMAFELVGADIVIWLMAEDESGDRVDVTALEKLKSELQSRAGLLSPALIPVALDGPEGLGHALSPVQAAERAAALSKALGSPDILPVMLADIDAGGAEIFNGLVQALEDVRLQARRVHLVRRVARLKHGRTWMRSGRQALAAAGSLTRAMLKRSRGETSGASSREASPEKE